MPGSIGHLVSRFFDYLTSNALTADEVRTVASWLTAEEQALFFAQSAQDQAHGLRSARHVESSARGTGELTRAALLHDVGKRHSRLGVVGRSVASILIKLRAPLTERMRAYRDHGEIGAADLASAGSPLLVVDFARAHHGEKPPTIDTRSWEILQMADRQ